MHVTGKELEDLSRLDVGDIHRDESLQKYGMWRIGGPADCLVEPRSIEQLCRLRRYLYEHRIASVVIGEGSNLLFDDTGLRSVAIKIGRSLSAFGIDGKRVWAETGIAVPRLARAVGMAGLTGIEHTIGIPGTLGGLVVMNGGSRRESVGTVVRFVEVIDRRGDVHRKWQDECGFAYRRSWFQSSDDVLVKVELELEHGEPEAIRRDMLTILRDRRRKFPHRRLPNCGSVFVSGGELYERFGPPGKVIEELGFKGSVVGSAQVSPKHANFIINLGDATASDVCELIRRIRVAVHEKTNIWMDCEVRHVMPDGRVRPIHEVLQ